MHQYGENKVGVIGDHSSGASPNEEVGVWPYHRRSETAVDSLANEFSSLGLNLELIKSTESYNHRTRARSAGAPVPTTGPRVLYRDGLTSSGPVTAVGEFAGPNRRLSQSPKGLQAWMNATNKFLPGSTDLYDDDNNDGSEPEFFEDDNFYASSPPTHHKSNPDNIVYVQQQQQQQHKVKVRRISQSSPQTIKTKSTGARQKKSEMDKNENHVHEISAHSPVSNISAGSNSNANKERDNSQFELNLEAILKGDETRASLMIKVCNN